MNDQDNTTAPIPELGICLRRIRQKNNLKIEQVAKLSGLSRSTLSKVENGHMSLTYENIVRLARGLDVDIADFFLASTPERATPVTARRVVGRGDDVCPMKTAHGDYRYLCADLSQRQLIPIKATLRSRSLQEFGAPVSHPGEEFAYILKGRVEVHTEHYQPTILEVGDYIYLDSVMKHAFLSVGDEDAELLWVCSSPLLMENIHELSTGPDTATTPASGTWLSTD
ncbi:XRE family transcriptional regulator [Haliea sp. E1-2-M8]|uniref:helix-turn-helix domain-containing protein n=1 Tax=Haliea sp. E1-2-M8 TaxID=3064706 RepID=UPI00271E65F9|nr:XRE family transcriptional regulator [Haliea sp. E1-2-M8]MDO8864022.1 XRE family transcriptional regulator [Haliea sp. E1-2-M8]